MRECVVFCVSLFSFFFFGLVCYFAPSCVCFSASQMLILLAFYWFDLYFIAIIHHRLSMVFKDPVSFFCIYFQLSSLQSSPFFTLLPNNIMNYRSLQRSHMVFISKPMCVAWAKNQPVCANPEVLRWKAMYLAQSILSSHRSIILAIKHGQLLWLMCLWLDAATDQKVTHSIAAAVWYSMIDKRIRADLEAIFPWFFVRGCHERHAASISRANRRSSCRDRSDNTNPES